MSAAEMDGVSAHDRPGGAPIQPRDDDGPSLLTVANVLLRHRRIILVLPLLLGLAAVAFAMSRDREYTASATILPEVEQTASSGLSGLASQLGVSVGAPRVGESMEFYSELLRSRELLREAVLTHYSIAGESAEQPDSATLVEVYAPESVTPEGKVRASIARLRNDVTTVLLPRAGLIKVETTAPTAELAVQINRRLLELLNEFNLQKRRSKSAAEREFIEGRLAEARGELRNVEEQLESFLRDNRQYRASPQLTFAAARLERELELRQQVYMSLAQAYEQARVEEVRNTPVVTVLERPEGSARPQSRRLAWSAVTGLVVGLVLAFGLAFLFEVFAGQRRRRPEEFQEFLMLRDAWLRGLVPFRGRRRLPPSGSRDPAVTGRPAQ